MKNILIVGALDSSGQAFVHQLSNLNSVNLTVYTPSQVTLPGSVTGLTGELIDEGGLSAAMLDQDAVVALVPTIRLAAVTQTIVTAAQATGTSRVVVSRTDDIDELPGELRAAQRALIALQTADLVTGLGSVRALLGLPMVVSSAQPRVSGLAG
ncbi:NAD(P)H-binding protein [Levilactobacillus huananensis]|uniref:NAD(P)H-binding protein n=1 Tax=Levilactobacillus huananensis TaxID=2486019 RepID=UPI000F78EACC|nr:NAD(P)H-binding protein [Levilactobacillus huananensis]